MEKHEETRYVKRTQKITSMSFKLQIVQEIERQLTVTNPQRLMVFKIEQLLLNGSENSVTLIKTKHHLLCQSARTKIMELEAKVKL
jgi:hypothetical protein